MSSDVEKIGIVGNDIVDKFALDISPDTPIFIGLNNRIHMENNHGEIYRTYSERMCEIISGPDYVGVNPHDNSLEYYKNYNDAVVHIKLAARPSKSGVFFAKTMFDISDSKLQSYLSKGRIKQCNKK
ncbi:MAG: hypothetical protein ACI4F2_01180 [Acutalibacteraceae bacterium]